MRHVFLLFALFALIASMHTLAEEKLPLKSVITDFVPTTKDSFSMSFSKAAVPWWGLVLGSSGVLYYYDEKIYSGGQKLGRDWGIGNEDNTKPILQAYGQELVRVPSDTGSFLYFLGDGWMHAGIAAGFSLYGNYAESTKAFNTGLMIAHGMVVSTVFNQAIKRSTGRESPEVKTSERGSWNLFPSVKEYNSRTASYDAVPSGHVMTATLTWTIITERYPEYRPVLYPIAGLWITALGFQMVNNGVHWASDYPLGIAMGYVFGKASTRMINRQKKKDEKEADETAWMVLPVMNNGVSMLTATRAF